jgi:hypothetical protein
LLRRRARKVDQRLRIGTTRKPTGRWFAHEPPMIRVPAANNQS